jgi:hypothetical protein
MTYAFEFRLPNVQEGSEEAEKEVQKLKGVSTVVVLLDSMGANGRCRWRRKQ